MAKAVKKKLTPVEQQELEKVIGELAKDSSISEFRIRAAVLHGHLSVIGLRLTSFADVMKALEALRDTPHFSGVSALAISFIGPEDYHSLRSLRDSLKKKAKKEQGSTTLDHIRGLLSNHFQLLLGAAKQGDAWAAKEAFALTEPDQPEYDEAIRVLVDIRMAIERERR